MRISCCRNCGFISGFGLLSKRGEWNEIQMQQNLNILLSCANVGGVVFCCFVLLGGGGGGGGAIWASEHHYNQRLMYAQEWIASNDFVHYSLQTITWYNTLTHWGRDKMAANFLTIFSNTFFLMKIYEFRLRFHRRLSLRFQLTKFPH